MECFNAAVLLKSCLKVILHVFFSVFSPKQKHAKAGDAFQDKNTLYINKVGGYMSKNRSGSLLTEGCS